MKVADSERLNSVDWNLDLLVYMYKLLLQPELRSRAEVKLPECLRMHSQVTLLPASQRLELHLFSPLPH